MVFNNGIGGRWTLGIVVLVPVISFNVGGLSTLMGGILAAIFSILAAVCRSNTRSVQIPYLRTSHRIDFLWFFLALWMDLLALLAGCAILARTLSSCLDTMTGGLLRMWILGRNSLANDWPDVIGVTVVFLISGMFMLGLENTRIFGALMMAGMCGIVCQITIVSWLKGTLDNFHTKTTEEPKPEFGIVIGCALMTFLFPMENPQKLFGRTLKLKLFNGLLLSTGIVLFFAVITTGSLVSIMKDNPAEESFIGVPAFQIMEDQGLSKIIPAIACMLVLACSGAIMELFPEMYQKIVQLTTSDWQILPKQIGYENREIGSPVLAIFTGGSLCAMLAFACPLENLIFILAGSHLLEIVFRSIYLLYIRFRPRILTTRPESTSTLNYSRLDSQRVHSGGSADGQSTDQPAMKISTSIRKFLNMANSEQKPPKGPKKGKRKVMKDPAQQEEMEKEWLLLGEPPMSPRFDRALNGEEGEATNQSTSTAECVIVDTKLIGDEPLDNEEDESDSTDIDAIVDEYREKVRITSGGPLETNVLKIPSKSSWRLAMVFIGLLFCVIAILDWGIYQQNLPSLAVGSAGVLIIIVSLHFVPKHVNQKQSEYQQVSISVLTLTGSLVLLVATFSQSWPALLFWLVSGLSLFVRLDLWCCPCLEKTEDVAIMRPPVFGSTHQLYLSETQPTLLITNPLPKGQFIATRLPIRGR